MKTEIIIVIDEQEGKTTGKFIVLKNGVETENISVERSVPEKKQMSFREELSEKLYKS